ncbi:ISXO2-like transposase domain protein [compost metagenome]
MFDSDIRSVPDLFRKFPDQKSCIRYLEEIIWRGRPESPFAKEGGYYRLKNDRYKCKTTGKYFNVMHGTMFENTKIELQKWFYAIWLITSHKKGIASTQLSVEIEVTQKTAWFMLQRIRACFGIENGTKLSGVVEVDETFVGGKNKNRHKDKKVPMCQGRAFKDKTPVLGMLQRGGNITCIVIPNTRGATIKPLIRKFVEPGSRLISDEWQAYNGLGSEYEHFQVDHSKKNYVNLDDNTIHSNSVESAWNVFKRSVSGMYVKVSKKYLQMYVDEFVYRFNMRKIQQSDRFNWLILNSDTRTKYKPLTRGEYERRIAA